MSIAWLFRVESGAFSMLFLALLVRQIVRREVVCLRQRQRAWGSVEAMVLLGVTAIIVSRYLAAMLDSYALKEVPGGQKGIPELAVGWLIMFGAGCGVYLGAKAVRAFRTQST